MIKVLTIIGARPQIIKAAAISRAIKNNFSDKMQEIILHTGQHYDDNMSQVFFDELEITKPNYNLKVGSASQGKQTAMMIEGIEEVILKENPTCIVLYGDTNSTLAGAIAGSKLLVPIIHVEAGLRSFNKSMPEEINRIMCDSVSTLLFSPTLAGYTNLLKEGFRENNRSPYTIDNPKIYHCGDVMYDNCIYYSTKTESIIEVLREIDLTKEGYVLATIHRNSNTDDPNRLSAIFEALNKISRENNLDIIIPLHPRTSKLLEEKLSPGLYNLIKENSLIKILPPVSYLEMLGLERNSKLIITDSGGVQKEAFFFRKPCVILRSETEWVELIECGAAIIADVNKKIINDSSIHFINNPLENLPNIFGNGKAAEFICTEIINNFS
jgi:UDP-GlcNAc3NAcA epimerase